jgi:hypothetical protein
LNKSYKKNKTNNKNRILFGILFLLIFSSTMINAVGYPNDLSINDPNSYETLLENLNGDECLQLRGTGSYASATSGNGLFDYSHENGYDITIPNYDYAGATIEISPKYYYRDIQSSGSFTYTTSTTKAFSSGYSYASDISSRVSSIDYTTRYTSPDVVGLNAWTWSSPSGGFIDVGTTSTSVMEVGGSCNGYDEGAWAQNYRTLLGVGSTYAEAGIEIGFEITNSNMDSMGKLDWDDSWALTNMEFNTWLSSPTGTHTLVEGKRVRLWIEIMAKTSSGSVYSYELVYIDRSHIDPWGHAIIQASDPALGYTGSYETCWLYNGYQNINSYSSSVNLVDINRYSTQTQVVDHYTHTGFTSSYGNPIITYRIKGLAWHDWVLCNVATNIRSCEANAKQSFTYTWGSGSMNDPYDAYFQLTGDSTKYSLNTNVRRRNGWNNRYASSDLMYFYSDYYDGYESMSISVHHAKAYHYLSDTNTRNKLSFVGISMPRESTKWSLYTPDLDASGIYTISGDHAYIDMLLSITEWDSGWESYIGLIWSYTINFEEFAYNNLIPYDSGSGSFIYGESGYYRHININWNEIILTDTYLNTLVINSFPYTISPAFQSYTLDDVPQWMTSESLSIDWNEGTSGVSIHIDITTDIVVPIITDYSTVSSIHDDEAFEFYVVKEIGEVNIREAYLILEDTSTLVRSSIALENDFGSDKFYHINEYGDIIPSTYNAWYGLQDDAGNWRTTPSFSLEVIPAEIVIYDVSVEDYEFGTTGHYLSFRITNTFPKDYWVYIDSFLVDDGQWTLDTLISVNIDGYGIDVHDIHIIANDQNLIEGTYDTSFRVYQTPIFNAVPSDNTYVDIYGNFDLIWDVSDNNLDNYTLFRDSSPIHEDDFINPTHQILTFTEDTNLLTITTHAYLLIVRDGEGREIQDSVDITIIPYESPIIIFHHPDYTYTEDPTVQLIQIEIFSIPEVPISAVNWDLKHSADPYNWKSLIYNPVNERWESTFDPMIYERGDYELWIKVVDPFMDTSAFQTIQLDQMLPYYFIDTDISRTTSNIFVSENGDDSDEINAHISVIHNIVVKERNFEIYLPTRYDDAFDYYLMRDFNRYEPELAHSTGYYTEWRLPSYQASDIIYFQLEKPYITNEAVVGGLGESYEMDFTLTSKYAFSDLTVHNTFNHYFTNPEDYEFTLMYLFGVNWYDVEDITVQYSNMVEIQFDWASIEEDTTVEFKIIAKPLVQIYDVSCPDYTYLSTENFLNFTIDGGEPDFYNVTIDENLKASGIWIVDEVISINIDGYGRGIHNVTVYANDTLGTEDIYECTFGVYEYPVFLSKPIDNKYVNLYGEFELFWDIIDNSLKNYTLLLNDVIIEEGNFAYPTHDNVSYIDDTNTLGIQIHNYSLIVRDNEGLTVQDDVFIEIITYQNPLIDIIEPNEAIITDILGQLIQVNISTIPEVPLVFVQWDLKQSPDSFSWENLTYNVFSELWEDIFNPLNYEYGDYELWVKVTDPFDDTTEYISFALHQLIPYYYTLSNTSRTSANIIISYDSSETTDINGMVVVNHDLIVKEHDFEIYIPLSYEDAFDYSLVRGFDIYYPSNFFTTSRYTLWNLPDYQPLDTVNFFLEKPSISNGIVEVDSNGKICQEFSLYSKHSFENLTIHNKINHLVSYPDRYIYYLYYYYGGDWIQISNDSYSIQFGSFIEFDLEWDSINDDQTILFKYEAVPIQEPVIITDLEYDDYEFETIGNNLSFTLYHEFPNEYFVFIDGTTIATGTYSNGQHFEISIDGYDIDLHNLTIRANSYFGITTEINATFRVYQTPVFLSRPSSALFVEAHGYFDLFWEIIDNGLINYTLLYNNNIIEEQEFLNPLNATIFLSNTTQNLGIGLHNYTLIIRDNDTLIVQDVVLIQIISYTSPTIDILKPDKAIITDISSQLIECNITSMPEVPIVSVQWDLKRTGTPYNWKDMAFNGITYDSYFDPLDYEYGDYELWVNVTDLFTNVSSFKNIRLEQFIPYTIEQLDITRKSSEINIGLYDDDTTDIIAYFNLIHHLTAMERDFSIDIPVIYSDAFNYHINRGFDRYEPTEPYIDGLYTEWHLPTFQSEDMVYFELQKPTLRNDVINTKDDGTIEMEFTLDSKHAFTNLTLQNTVTYYFADASLYTYTLSYLFGGEWYYLNSTDYTFNYDAFISFDLHWSEIGSDSTVIFRFHAIPKPEVVSPFNWVLGGIFVPIGLFFWLLFAGAVGRKWEDWGMVRFVIYTSLVAGASLGVGLLAGFFIQGSIFPMIIPN